MQDLLFETAHSFTKKWEGSFSDDPADRGGITNHGVSLVFLRQFSSGNRTFLQELGIVLPISAHSIRALTKAQAKAIFYKAFWLPLGIMPPLPQAVATFLYDCAVNHGKGAAVRMAQRACNDVLGKPVLAIDGLLGAQSRAALRLCDARMVLQLCAQRRAFFQRIADRDNTQKRFLAGWLNRCNDLEKTMLSQLEGA